MATKTERFMAIFIGVIMLGSVIGFALMSTINPQQEAPEIPSIINNELSTDEVIYILRSGKVLIENFYTSDCVECLDKKIELESFVNRFKDFTVLENVVVNQTNETRLQMIGIGGTILKLENTTINQNNLLEKFCSVAMSQPIECLLKD